MAARQATVFILGKEFDTTELGRKGEAASNARLRQKKPRAVARIRHRDLCFNLGKLPAYLRQNHQNDIIEMLRERLSVRPSARAICKSRPIEADTRYSPRGLEDQAN